MIALEVEICSVQRYLSTVSEGECDKVGGSRRGGPFVGSEGAKQGRSCWHRPTNQTTGVTRDYHPAQPGQVLLRSHFPLQIVLGVDGGRGCILWQEQWEEQWELEGRGE